MGLFGRFFGKARDGKDANGTRCMECGMTGGEHTDWCPAAATEESNAARGTTSEEPTRAEGPPQTHP